jgi:phosphate transport system permease protein
VKYYHKLLEYLFKAAAFGSGLMTVAVFCLMLYLGWPLLQSGQFFEMLSQSWRPSEGIYGIYPMLVGSLSISFLALCISLPMSIGVACVATTLAPQPIRAFVLAMIRFMAGIPTVVYGFVAIFLLVPLMREQITGGSGMNILTASLVLAFLIAPTMIVFFVNGLTNIPKPYCLAIDALGARPIQKLLYLLIPQSWSCIISGSILGLGRAMGDTLISLMVAGNSVAIPGGVGDSARTLTAHIALVVAADLNSMEFKTIFACGLVLYLSTVVMVVGLRLLAVKVMVAK